MGTDGVQCEICQPANLSLITSAVYIFRPLIHQRTWQGTRKSNGEQREIQHI